MKGLLTALLLVIACGTPQPTQIECLDLSECDRSQICEDFTCIDVECTTSTQCALGTYCSETDYSCTAGCQVDGDCAATDICDASVCVPRPCRSSHLDCPVGSYCNPTTGDCVVAEGVCDTCERTRDCEGNQECIQFHSSQGSYCYVSCVADADCPAGFFCRQDNNPPVCYAECEWLVDNFWL